MGTHVRIKDFKIKKIKKKKKKINGNPLQYSCLEKPMDRRLVGYGPWGRKGSDTTEVTAQVPKYILHFHYYIIDNQ